MLSIQGASGEYYSPYPTLTTMRGQPAALGQPDSKSRALEGKLRQLAKEYGVKLPRRPGDLTKGQAQVADILEIVDIISAQLALLSKRFFAMAAKGGAPCEQLLAYNQQAIRFYEAQREILAELRGEGVPGVPMTPPWPPLFVGFGNYAAAPAESFWELNCDARVVGLATTQNPSGVKITMSKPCPELGGAAITAFGIFVAGAVIYGVGRKYIEATVQKEKLRTTIESQLQTLRCMKWKADLLDTMADKCVASRPGAKYEDCVYEVEQSIADLDCLEAQKQAAKIAGGNGVGRSWLWWVGLAAVVVGGVVVYRHVKKRPARGRQRGAEIINVPS
jgi:hypothetical protein